MTSRRELAGTVAAWDTHGFVVLPSFLPRTDLAAAVAELAGQYPTSDEFHDDVDPVRNERFRDEFAGVDTFPVAGVELNLLCVHPRLIELAAALLRTDDLRLYCAETWAKYTGAADYDQLLHRDYLNHTILALSDDLAFKQVEMFLYLSDVSEQHGPPHYVSRQHSGVRAAMPNWLPAAQEPELYDVETSAAGPAGTVVAYEIGTFHRGTQLTAPRGARYTIHLNFRPAASEWAVRVGWADRAYGEAWCRFVARASVRQLQLFGFPPPGHAYWTPSTLAQLGQRYPGLDVTAWEG